MIRRILLATDFSEHAERAAEAAAVLAGRSGARTILFHAAPPDGAERARSELEKVRLRLPCAATAVETLVVESRPAPAICETTVRVDADLVLVGTRSRPALARPLLGSVAEEVVQGCPRDVLVVRDPPAPEGFRSILTATDLSPGAERAIRTAAELSATTPTSRSFTTTPFRRRPAAPR